MVNKDYYNMALVASHFNPEALRFICELHEEEFGDAFGMTRVNVGVDRFTTPGNDFYFFKDNGAKVLAVAHLDTVMDHENRDCHFVDTQAGPVVFSGALDDRLGAYVILDLLPALGIQYDILLTVGEEMGESTATYFQTEKEYDWIIEFDRGGTDVVMYQYHDEEVEDMVRSVGARVAQGAFSDISYMEHLGIKGFNWGVGYQDYHGPRSHAFLYDTFEMVGYYLDFHEEYQGVAMPHFPRPASERYTSSWWKPSSFWGQGSESQREYDWDENGELIDPADYHDFEPIDDESGWPVCEVCGCGPTASYHFIPDGMHIIEDDDDEIALAVGNDVTGAVLA